MYRVQHLQSRETVEDVVLLVLVGIKENLGNIKCEILGLKVKEVIYTEKVCTECNLTTSAARGTRTTGGVLECVVEYCTLRFRKIFTRYTLLKSVVNVVIFVPLKQACMLKVRNMTERLKPKLKPNSKCYQHLTTVFQTNSKVCT